MGKRDTPVPGGSILRQTDPPGQLPLHCSRRASLAACALAGADSGVLQGHCVQPWEQSPASAAGERQAPAAMCRPGAADDPVSCRHMSPIIVRSLGGLMLHGVTKAGTSPPGGLVTTHQGRGRHVLAWTQSPSASWCSSRALTPVHQNPCLFHKKSPASFLQGAWLFRRRYPPFPGQQSWPSTTVPHGSRKGQGWCYPAARSPFLAQEREAAPSLFPGASPQGAGRKCGPREGQKASAGLSAWAAKPERPCLASKPQHCLATSSSTEQRSRSREDTCKAGTTCFPSCIKAQTCSEKCKASLSARSRFQQSKTSQQAGLFASFLFILQ